MEPRHHRPRFIATLAIAAALFAGCAASGARAPSAVPAASAAGSAAASMPPPASSDPVDDPAEAAQRVVAANPTFTGLRAFDPELAGQCCWYDVREVADGYRVVIELGWGDCQSGCIERHRWTYAVAQDGTSRLIAEDGASLPPGPLPK